MFELVSSPATEPITLDDARTHLNLTTGDFDGFLAGLVTAARELVEKEINGSVITTGFNYYPDCFGFPVAISKGNILAVSAVSYRTQDGQWHDLDNTLWDFTSYSREVFLKPNATYTTGSLYPRHPMRISFTAGFGATRQQVPAAIKHAVKIILSHLFEHREDGMSEMPFPARMILSHYQTVTPEMF
jgi:uncharacterized phiE125 gp8 family phage protein